MFVDPTLLGVEPWLFVPGFRADRVIPLTEGPESGSPEGLCNRMTSV